MRKEDDGGHSPEDKGDLRTIKVACLNSDALTNFIIDEGRMLAETTEGLDICHYGISKAKLDGNFLTNEATEVILKSDQVMDGVVIESIILPASFRLIFEGKTFDYKHEKTEPLKDDSNGYIDPYSLSVNVFDYYSARGIDLLRDTLGSMGHMTSRTFENGFTIKDDELEVEVYFGPDFPINNEDDPRVKEEAKLRKLFPDTMAFETPYFGDDFITVRLRYDDGNLLELDRGNVKAIVMRYGKLYGDFIEALYLERHIDFQTSIDFITPEE